MVRNARQLTSVEVSLFRHALLQQKEKTPIHRRLLLLFTMIELVRMRILRMAA